MLRLSFAALAALAASTPLYAQHECSYPTGRQPADLPPALTDYPGTYQLIVVRISDPPDTAIGRLRLSLTFPAFQPVHLFERCNVDLTLCTPGVDSSAVRFPLTGSADFATANLPFVTSHPPSSRSALTPGVIARLGDDAWLEMWIGGSHGAHEGLPGPFAIVNRRPDGFGGWWRDAENEFSRRAGYFCAIRGD